ncbi:MAG: hypothetical protein CR988_03840 [Treponema sp.]|nr:MAG: hypothetical protein CR988_03840 [Treponema sp.]
MKKNNILKKEIFIFIAVTVIFILPPVFYTGEFTLPKKPQTSEKWILFGIWILILALYEEILYRWYLPSRLTLFFNIRQSSNITTKLTAEIIPVILFGIAHRHLGLLSILYAILAGIIFRLIFRKIKSHLTGITCVTLIHFIHNIAVYCLLFYKN